MAAPLLINAFFVGYIILLCAFFEKLRRNAAYQEQIAV